MVPDTVAGDRWAQRAKRLPRSACRVSGSTGFFEGSTCRRGLETNVLSFCKSSESGSSVDLAETKTFKQCSEGLCVELEKPLTVE